MTRLIDCQRVAVRRVFRRVALIAAILAGALLLLVGIAHLPFVRALVLDQARAYAARELGVALDAKSLHYNLFGPSAELRDVTLASLDDKDRRPLVRADRLRLVRDSDGRARFWVEGRKERVAVIYGPKYEVAVVYAPSGRDFICFEPMAAVTNAFNLAQAGLYKELQSVAPGGQWKESFWISATGF